MPLPVTIERGLKRIYRNPSSASNTLGVVPDIEYTTKGVLLPSKYALYEFMDDFSSFTVAAANLSGWIIQQTGTGTAGAIQDEAFGVVKFVTGTTAGNDIQYRWGLNTTPHQTIVPATGKRMWLASRFKTEDADQDTFYVGANVSTADAFAGEPTDQFRFRSGATADALQFACGKTNTTEVTISLGAMADNTYVNVLAFYDGFDTVHAFRFNDAGDLSNSGSVSVTPSVRGDLLPDTVMCPAFGGQTEDTGGDDFSFDYLYIAVER